MLVTAEDCYYDLFAGSAEYSPAGMMGSRIENTSWSVSADFDDEFFYGCNFWKSL